MRFVAAISAASKPAQARISAPDRQSVYRPGLPSAMILSRGNTANGIAKWIDFAWFATLAADTTDTVGAQNAPDVGAGPMESAR
jgi:hypothetical protein